MENNKPNTRVRRAFFKTFHKKIKDNPEVIDFYSKLISSIITLLALGATIYFSLKALSKTDIQNQNAGKQLKQAKSQLTLAQQQFQYAKRLHTEDSISSAKKDKIANDRFILDTIKQAQREKMQELQNQLQNAASKQQFVLNKSQLKAIQIQAKTAKAQFRQQQSQYQQQIYEQRPVFLIDSVHNVTVNSVKSTTQVFISNKGIRTAHIDTVVFAFYNHYLLESHGIVDLSNLDLIPEKNYLATDPINIYEDCLNSHDTIYYLLICYRDKTTGASQKETIFFTYGYTKEHQFYWTHVLGPLKDDFITELKSKNIFVSQ